MGDSEEFLRLNKYVRMEKSESGAQKVDLCGLWVC
jgi:hypothetical protein